MSETRRVIIVRSGDRELFEQLRIRFADDPATVIRYDRRIGARRRARQAVDRERRESERRDALDAFVLCSRGYVVIRTRARSSYEAAQWAVDVLSMRRMVDQA